MKYGLLVYEESEKFFNIGDYIQSLAAKQFLPRVDVYLNREQLANYKGEKIKLIMNGWFTHNAKNWIPSDDIQPLFVSFHINNTAAKEMLSDEGIKYLKKHQPIGCRDQYTVDILTNNGIDAYFTGCLTTTLDLYKSDVKEDKVYIVDPLYSYPRKEKIFYSFKEFIKSILKGKIFKLGLKDKHLNNFLDPILLNDAIYTNQEPSSKTYNDDQKFKMAEELLSKYAKAKLVITSRIHCALPCLAMNTPVIFVNGFDSFVDTSRFNGIIELFNRIDIDSTTGHFKSNFNLENKIDKNTKIDNLGKHELMANNLKETCRNFINS